MWNGMCYNTSGSVCHLKDAHITRAEGRTQKSQRGHQIPGSQSKINGKPHQGEEMLLNHAQAASSQKVDTGENWQCLQFPEPGVGRSRGNKTGLVSYQENLSCNHRREAEQTNRERANVKKMRTQDYPDRPEGSVQITSVNFCRVTGKCVNLVSKNQPQEYRLEGYLN